MRPNTLRVREVRTILGGDPVRYAELIRPDSVRVWGDKGVRERLSWYYRVMRNSAPAKFIIAKRIPTDIDPTDRELGLDELLRVHSRLKEEFNRVWRDVRESPKPWKEIPSVKPKHTFLDVKAVIAYRLASPCRLCERRCGVKRDSGEVGVCRVRGLKACVDTYFHHVGEEAPLVPSGTIFYTGCNFRCVYCQNWSISQPATPVGEEGCLDAKELATIQEWLRVSGARNVNHVGGDPTPNLPVIVDSLRYLEVNVPQLWNSNMYLSELSMEVLEDLIDIWLPDVKYGNDECAVKYSGVPNYVEVIKRNVARAAKHGDMIVRHLVLPNHVRCCTEPVIKWLAKATPSAVLNIMDQYHPDYLVRSHPEKWGELARHVSGDEMSEAFRIARECGYGGPVEDLWYIPP